MFRIILIIFFLSVVQLAIAAAAYPKRIVSLTPNVTEILYAIGAGPQVVGALAGSDYPKAAQKLPRVGGYDDINFEAIAKLQPDMVISWRNMIFPGTILELSKLGIPVRIVGTNTLEGIVDVIIQLGDLTGHAARARDVAMSYKRQLLKLKKDSVVHQKKIRVFVQLNANPIFTPTSDSLINQVIELCNGRNVFGDLDGAANEVVLGAVLKANPEVIIALTPVDVSWWERWPNVSAVRHHQLYEIPADLLARPGPRLMQGATMVCHDIQKARQVLAG